jgi:hypothetical protein
VPSLNGVDTGALAPRMDLDEERACFTTSGTAPCSLVTIHMHIVHLFARCTPTVLMVVPSFDIREVCVPACAFKGTDGGDLVRSFGHEWHIVFTGKKRTPSRGV